MKKIFILACISIMQLQFAQVSYEKGKLYEDGQSYRSKDYKQVFQNEEALNYFKKARINNSVGNIFGFAGGGFMGFGLARLLSGNKTTIITNNGTETIKTDNSNGWALMGIGAGLVGIGIPFALSSKKNADKAIQIENGETTTFKPYFKIETSGTALALSYNF